MDHLVDATPCGYFHGRNPMRRNLASVHEGPLFVVDRLGAHFEPDLVGLGDTLKEPQVFFGEIFGSDSHGDAHHSVDLQRFSISSLKDVYGGVGVGGGPERCDGACRGMSAA